MSLENPSQNENQKQNPEQKLESLDSSFDLDFIDKEVESEKDKVIKSQSIADQKIEDSTRKEFSSVQKEQAGLKKVELANRALALADKIESGEATDDQIEELLSVNQELEIDTKEVVKIVNEDDLTGEITAKENIDAVAKAELAGRPLEKDVNENMQQIEYLLNQEFPTEKLGETGVFVQGFVDLADEVRRFFPGDSNAVENLISVLHAKNPNSICGS